MSRRDASLFGPYQRDDSSGLRSWGKSLGLLQPFPTMLTTRNVLPAVSQRHQTHITSSRNSSIRRGLPDLQCPNIHVFVSHMRIAADAIPDSSIRPPDSLHQRIV